MNEESLIKKLKQRDSGAFEYLMNKYSKLLFHAADEILNRVASEADIEDCVSDVYFKFWKNIDRFDSDKSNLKNYLVLITKSVAIDLYRKKSAHMSTELNENIIFDEQSTEQILLKNEELENLNQAMNRLDATDREIIKRRYFYDEKPSQISKKMDLPVRNIENRLYRTKLKLKEFLTRGQ